MGVGFNNTDEIIISEREFRDLVEAETRRSVAVDLIKSNIFVSAENIYLVLTGEKKLAEKSDNSGLSMQENK